MTTERASTTGAGSSGTGAATLSDATDSLPAAAGAIAGRVSGTAQMEIGSRAESGLARAGEVLGGVAGAIRQGGEQLRTEQPQVAGLADAAATQVERASSFLRETDLNGLVREAEDFARRQPALFLGGALALGLVASRFLKASPRDGEQSRSAGRDFGHYDPRYGRAGNGNGGYGGQGGDRATGGYVDPGVTSRSAAAATTWERPFDATAATPAMGHATGGTSTKGTSADEEATHGRA